MYPKQGVSTGGEASGQQVTAGAGGCWGWEQPSLQRHYGSWGRSWGYEALELGSNFISLPH